MRIFFIWGTLCALLTHLSCSSGHDQSTRQGHESEALPQMDYAVSTAKMATLIARAFQDVDPAKLAFLVEDKRLTLFSQQLNHPDIGQRLSASIYYANELLNLGKTEQAIVQFESIVKELDRITIARETDLLVRRMLALSYLRLGEQENCISTRNHESCILPISRKGQYRLTRGSETAMRHCTDILKKYPDDAETIWLLNLAAMTIGKYPKEVPVQWRVPPDQIVNGSPFSKFNDISHNVGITGPSLAGGVCVEDFDGDGFLDILTSSWGNNDPLKMWKNTGNGTFVDVSEHMGLPGITSGLNIAHTDINNDGLPDVFVLRGAWMRDQGKVPNSLLLNLGDGTFADITIPAGILTFAPTQSIAIADFNLDGWVDFFIGNESSHDASFANELYLNNHDNTFRNVISEIGVNTTGFIKGCAVGDINNDGLPDIYISYLPGKNKLLLNRGPDENGIPQFENIAHAAGVEEPLFSFPTWIWDFDNDGWEDIFVSSYGDGQALAAASDFVQNAQGQQLNAYPRIYRNKRDNTFEDITATLGLTDNHYTMGCNYGDLDGDGYLDFYLATGTPELSSVVPNKMYRNVLGRKLEDVTAHGGFGHIQKGHGVGFGDLDRDGDEDIFVVMGGAFAGDVYENLLFENTIGQDNSWTVLQLRGIRANRAAVGARVKVKVQTSDSIRAIHRTVSTGGSFGASSLQLEIGLGDAIAISEIRITWPTLDQHTQVIKDVQLNRYIRITEMEDEIEYLDVTPSAF